MSDEIREAELRRYLTLQAEIKSLSFQLGAKKDEFEKLHLSLLDKIERKWPCVGRLRAIIELVPTDTRPSWKNIAIMYGQRLSYTLERIAMDGQAEARSRRSREPHIVIVTNEERVA